MDAQARTLASGRFVSWPKVQVDTEQPLGAKPAKCINVAALKMNAHVLEHFAGHSYVHKKLGHVDFLHAGLAALRSSLWKQNILQDQHL